MSGPINLPVLDCQGNQVDTVQIDPAEFGGKINRQLLHQVVVMYQANLRQGTAKCKSRAEVAGSGRKMYP
ncbi:MAG TPA: 50S ribosomal protein L4, partial [Planctomycetaceae bacterium]|nr:50S ribosomal protein L4 [Planctomycetaceae bacterium]